MGTKKIITILFLGIVSMLIYFSLGIDVHASGASINTSPKMGDYQTGDTFNAQVIIDGAGTAFNAAKATVVLSPSLSVQNVTFGDCGFAYVRTPSQTDPSFAGVILGDSSTRCTAYTLLLKAIKSGVGSITFVNGSVKAYKGAAELLSATNNAAYNITGDSIQSSSTPTKPPVITKQGIKLYTILANIEIPTNTPLAVLKVILDPNLPTQRKILGSESTFTNPVVFDRVPEGVHTLVVFSNDKISSKQIVNAGGPNGTLVFGISAEKRQTPWLLYALSLLSILIIAFTGAIAYKKVHKNSKEIPEKTTV